MTNKTREKTSAASRLRSKHRHCRRAARRRTCASRAAATAASKGGGAGASWRWAPRGRSSWPHPPRRSQARAASATPATKAEEVVNGWEGCSKDGQRSPRRRAACGGAERGAADQQRPLGLPRRTIESTGGARSSGPCRRWCGDTGCGLVLLATDEREVKELRQSTQKSITYQTRTATSPSAQKSSAKTFGRIVRAGELSERSDLVSAILNMCAGWAPQLSVHLTGAFGAAAQQTRQLAVHASGLLMRCGSGGCELPAGVRPGRPMPQPLARARRARGGAWGAGSPRAWHSVA